MNTQRTTPQAFLFPYTSLQSLKFVLPAVCFGFLLTLSARAGSATWSANPTSSEWNTAGNWTPGTVPNGPADVATFALSNTTGVSILANTEVDSIVFNPGASAFTITVNTASQLTISGAGVVNNSGITQNFVTTAIPNGFIDFTGNATAGSLTRFTNMGGNSTGNGVGFRDNSSAASATFVNHGGTDREHMQAGSTSFSDNSTAANATFINNPGKNAFGGIVVFFGNSTAASGTFLCNGGVKAHSFGGQAYFAETSTAADGVFTCSGTDSGSSGGVVTFRDDSSAGNATLLANGGLVAGGQINFDSFGAANGGTASVAVFDNGNLDISRAYAAAGITIGSLEGDGLVFLGAHTLAIGSNGRNTTFTGVIQDGGNAGGTGGSLAKVGTGTLILSGANTYTGATLIEQGTLLVKNRTGSATSIGQVYVDRGTLGGTGHISGGVSAGPSSRGTISPGSGATPGTLTVGGVVFQKRGAFKVDLNSLTATADKLVTTAPGSITVIATSATISLIERGNAALASGTVFTLIDNNSIYAIAGTFNNLPDGGTITAGVNTYVANYEGGDGNDLTLTVVP